MNQESAKVLYLNDFNMLVHLLQPKGIYDVYHILCNLPNSSLVMFVHSSERIEHILWGYEMVQDLLEHFGSFCCSKIYVKQNTFPF